MKQLIISLKSSSEVLKDFKQAFKKVKERQIKEPHYEISFDNRKVFERFVKNIYILSDILAFKPKSVYELSKLSGMDISNLNKIILFFEEIGVIQIKKRKIKGREVKTPLVNYDAIKIDLKKAA
jgi:predicted transcriptional regulator